MNYYPHNIGDFDKATRHLTRIERSIYRDLIDLYYDTEAQLPLDSGWICRRIIANSNEEATLVEQTLNEFFAKTPDGWYHDRCEYEIEHFRNSQSQKALAGKASAVARAQKRQRAINGNSTGVERALNERTTASQLNNNQEPITKNQEPHSVAEATGDKSPEELTKAELWLSGKSILEQQGMPKAQCGSFVGKLVKDYGDLIVVEAVRQAVVIRPADAAEYIKAICMRSAGARSQSPKTSKHSGFDKLNYHEGIMEDGTLA